MAIESIAGKRKYRQNPYNPRIIDVQYGHGQRWTTYAVRDTEKEARELVLRLGRDVKGEDHSEGV